MRSFPARTCKKIAILLLLVSLVSCYGAFFYSPVRFVALSPNLDGGGTEVKRFRAPYDSQLPAPEIRVISDGIAVTAIYGGGVGSQDFEPGFVVKNHGNASLVVDVSAFAFQVHKLKALSRRAIDEYPLRGKGEARTISWIDGEQRVRSSNGLKSANLEDTEARESLIPEVGPGETRTFWVRFWVDCGEWNSVLGEHGDPSRTLWKKGDFDLSLICKESGEVYSYRFTYERGG